MGSSVPCSGTADPFASCCSKLNGDVSQLRGSADGGTEVAFAHIPTGPTKTKRCYIDMDASRIVLTNAVPTMATVEDERQPGTLLFLADPQSCPDK